MKVKLYFRTFPNFELLEKGISVKTVRLLGNAQFQINNVWTNSYAAIIDTGAPFSLIPLEIWQNIQVEIIADSLVIRGLVPNKHCFLPVKVAKITLRLIDDEEHISKPLAIKAYLASTNKVPCIIGFQDILSEIRVYFSYKEKVAYIEEIK